MHLLPRERDALLLYLHLLRQDAVAPKGPRPFANEVERERARQMVKALKLGRRRLWRVATMRTDDAASFSECQKHEEYVENDRFYEN
jgi:hypothetical protein